MNTQGFQTVAEITETALLNILREAWKSGGLNGSGTLPQEIQLPAGLPLGPFILADGTVQVIENQIRIKNDPAINGVDVILGIKVDLEIANPPVPSAKLFNITADVTLKAPLAQAPDPKAPVNIALLFENLPLNAVAVRITSGDPFAAVLANGPEEYIHKLYQDGTLPHIVQDIPLSISPFSMKASIEFFDDETDLSKRITVNYLPGQMQVNMPCYVRFYDIAGDFNSYELGSPMGIYAMAQLTMPFSRTPNHIHIGTNAITTNLVNIQPAAGVEGTNYTKNKALVTALQAYIPLPSLDSAIQSAFVTAANTFFSGFPAIDFDIPVLGELEARVEAFIREEMNRRRYVILWAPTDAVGGVVITSITAKVLTDALVIALNAGAGANANALLNFIPGSCDFAIGIDDDFIKAKMAEGLPHLPITIPASKQTENHEIILKTIVIVLTDGAIEIKGSLTVVDAIPVLNTDIDVNFKAKIGLKWKDNADGSQIPEPFIIGKPDIDIELSILTWIITFLVGFISGGLIIGLILIVILAIVERIAESIGSDLVKDSAGKVAGLQAWPIKLPNIGTVKSRFKDPIDIYTTGIRFIGTLQPFSANTAALDGANANGPYSTAASALVAFNGGIDQVSSEPAWVFGDGQSSLLRRSTHQYGDSGLYVAKFRINVNAPGGVMTRNFTAVKLQNVPPKVYFDRAEIRVKEGNEIEIKGYFTDPEWLDKHTAVFDWGDNSKPTIGTLIETNTAPEAKGTVSAKHAWCDNGTFTLRLRVTDDDGGIGEATLRVIVENVPPVVKTPEMLCTLVGQCVVMQAQFEDNGWCDTHTAEWDFGDCHIKNAFVTETHEPPKAKGKAEACHVWAHCGKYVATATVTDDDGGIGKANTIVHAVELLNPMMEEGFRFPYPPAARRLDKVANGWLPYAEPTPSINIKAIKQPREWLFFGENFVEQEGRRGQGLRFSGTIQAGIYQTICANIGWDYEFSAHWHLVSARETAHVRIGIDPTGGTDPNSPKIVWCELPASVQEWRNITVRATAEKGDITLFVGGIDRDGGENTLYLDATHLCQIQPICDCPPPPKRDDPCKETCVDFKDIHPGSSFKPISSGKPNLIHHGIGFTSLDELRIINVSTPSPVHQVLFLGQDGIRVSLPNTVDKVKITFHNSGGGPDFKVEVLLGISSVKNMVLSLTGGTEQEFTIQATAFDALFIRGLGVELAIVKICFCFDDKPKDDEITTVVIHPHG